jgi:uncharacterized NAD(P)/FAD-binding protein YdhS
MKKIAIIGGGTAALYFLKAFVNAGNRETSVDIFEATENIAVGMPYSNYWSNDEHTVNIACKELPELVEEPHEWLMRQSDALLNQHGIKREDFSPLYIFPRRLFGQFHEAQFYALLKKAQQNQQMINVHTSCQILDIENIPQHNHLRIQLHDGIWVNFDIVVIATGHEWPKQKEDLIDGYYDSPFPLHKLNKSFTHPVGLLGSSLTAVDAMKTLAIQHGRFIPLDNGGLKYIPHKGTDNFRIIMHSRRGLLPSIRYYLEHSRIRMYENISLQQIEENIYQNNGYLSLDYIFQRSYKDIVAEKDPEVYAAIKEMSLEQFVDYYYQQEGIYSTDPFAFFQQQIHVSKNSEANQQPLYWKEAIEDTVYTLNFHAKSLSAEDMIRLRKYLMPLYYHAVIFLPYESCDVLIALRNAGKVDIVKLGNDSSVSVDPTREGAIVSFTEGSGVNHQTYYQTFIDCRGQRQLQLEDFPFKTLIDNSSVSPARVKFISLGEVGRVKNQLPLGCTIEQIDKKYYLRLPGLAFNDTFQVIDKNGEVNKRIYILAGPYIKGLSPDLSGIPFCNDASRIIVDAIINS